MYDDLPDEFVRKIRRVHILQNACNALGIIGDIKFGQGGFSVELNLQFILKSLSHEASWKAGDSVSFSFEDWNLTLKREEEKYKPFTFHLIGEKENANETWSRRYVRMELAYLHILNHFNENAVIGNPYKSLADIIERFPVRGVENDAFSKDYAMDLKQFLSYFDFDYDIVPPGGKYEDRIRQELIDDEKLTVEEADKDLICLIDCQGAYFGDIGKERFPINSQSIEKIIDRLNIYVNDFEVEFQEALEERGIDINPLSLSEMFLECKALGVGDGEVCFALAEAILNPDKIYIKEVLQRDKEEVYSQQPLDSQKYAFGDLVNYNGCSWVIDKAPNEMEASSEHPVYYILPLRYQDPDAYDALIKSGDYERICRKVHVSELAPVNYVEDIKFTRKVSLEDKIRSASERASNPQTDLSSKSLEAEPEI